MSTLSCSFQLNPKNASWYLTDQFGNYWIGIKSEKDCEFNETNEKDCEFMSINQ